jgi:inosose dehydratase
VTTVGAPIGRHLRSVLRRPGDALADASIGIVPIVWNNVDLADLASEVAVELVLDEVARTGFEGTQEGRGFPRGAALRDLLDARDLRLAEVYASIPCSVEGPPDSAIELARERLAILHDGGGDVLVPALDFSPERSPWSARASDPGVPRLSKDGWSRLAALANRLAAETRDLGHHLAWHPHTGTFVETPGEAGRLFDATDPDLVGICLDVGHWTVGGGDPVDAIRRFGERVTHVHLKDVDGDVLDRLRRASVPGWAEALRERLFTELGAGVIDLPAVLRALDDREYDGWLMVEQDSCWGPPAESAAIGRRVLAAELRHLGMSRTSQPD